MSQIFNTSNLTPDLEQKFQEYLDNHTALSEEDDQEYGQETGDHFKNESGYDL